jgi:hypothetical protein
MATDNPPQTENLAEPKTQVDQKSPYLEYLKENKVKVVKALKEKINNLMKSDQKKKISILEKSVTDSEGKLDQLKKLVNEYYFDEINNNDKKKEKFKILEEELRKAGDEYERKNISENVNLEDQEKEFEEKLDKLKVEMSDNKLKSNEVLKKFMEDNQDKFKELKLETDMNNFNTNISNLIKQLQSKYLQK